MLGEHFSSILIFLVCIGIALQSFQLIHTSTQKYYLPRDEITVSPVYSTTSVAHNPIQFNTYSLLWNSNN